MKAQHKKLTRFSSIIIALISFLISCGDERSTYEMNCLAVSLASLTETNENRESITFILGEDKEYDNPYYSEATNYYQFNEEGKTEYVITECRSLVEVCNYLTNHRPSNGLPWGVVNLVSHGNQWLGLSVRVTPESKRANTERILEYIEKGELKPVSDELLDSKSEIFIHGCGIGNNEALVKTIGYALGGNINTPKVCASRLFEYYSSVKHRGQVIESQRYYAQAWFTHYKMGYKPSNVLLTNELKEKYPDCFMDWPEVLQREQPRWNGDSYYYTFEVPVKWVIPFTDEDSIPDFKDKKGELEWISSQEEITDKLKRIEIPAEEFNWWIRKVYVKHEDKSRSPALWIKGYHTILCILKPLIENTDQTGKMDSPFTPDLEDEKYFYTYNPESRLLSERQ